jgi:aqualysin 1
MGRTLWRHARPVLLLAVLASCNPDTPAPTGVPTGISAPTALAPLVSVQGAIPDRYIVVLKAGGGDVSAFSQSIVSTHGGKVHYNYRYALKGFAATLSPAAVDALRRNPLVSLVSADGIAHTTIDQTSPPSWGLDRIDQRPLPLNSLYSYTKTGAGVFVYIIDTGIRTTHNEFGTRAVVGADFIGDGKNGQDCHGHGTHVAGTVAGNTYGVAKAARLIAVRIFDCTSNGSPWSTIIAGMDWVIADVNKPSTDASKVGGLPAVANMSLGGGFLASVNTAIQNMVNARVVAVVAAGNENQNACNVSPASAPAAITVGASTITDMRAFFSNWGSCVDLFAPGYGITSSWYTTNTAFATISGTSMASPHVAGVAALYLQGKPTTTLPATVANAIVGSASPNRLSDIGLLSPNRLLFSRLTASSAAFLLNPSALAFTFVRSTSPSTSIAIAKSVPAPTFAASGTGAPRPEQARTDGTVYVTAVATTASTTIQLSNLKTTARNWEATDNTSWISVTPPSGTVAGNASTALTASANSTGLPLGTSNGSITVKDVTPVTPVSYPIPVSLRVLEGTPLSSGVPITGLAGALGTQRYFIVTVPTGATAINIALSGGTGDADLYVRYLEPPDLGHWDCRPFFFGNNETCAASNPPAGTYYVMLDAFQAYSGATLLATVTAATVPNAPTTLTRTVVSSTRIDLAWTDASTNETSFKLYRRTRNADLTFGPWALVVSRPANTTSYSNTGLTPATSYQYRIRACNGAGCSAYKASTVATTLP